MPPAGRASERTRIQLCGRLSVEIAGAQIADGLRGKQVPLLLAYLVLNRSRHVARDELIGAVWPFQAPNSTDAALRTLLSRLRSALGPSTVVGRDEVILQLPEPVWIDLEAAAIELQRAIQSLEGGDARTAWALAQVPLNIATRGLLPGSHAGWLDGYRRELEDIRLQTLEVIGRAGLQIGGTQLGSVERSARSLIEGEPYRESGYALLMEANALRGNVAEGLRVFERLRTLLRDELGTSPSPQVIALHDRLLSPQATPPAAPRRRDDGKGEAVELPPELRAHAGAPMVGRRKVLEHLEELWRAAIGQGSGQATPARVASLVGDPGIGKTRLAAELAQRAHANGALVLAGRATQEALAPYQAFLGALRHYVAKAPAEQLRSHTREYGSELARLVPELRRRVPELPPSELGEPETERYRLFEAVVGLVRSLSQARPILLVLDDLHWADKPTLLLLRHLARAAEPSDLLILVAYRATEASSDGFSDALADLRRDRLFTSLHIDGLSESETAELVRVRTGEVPPAAFSRALHQRTEGNPFFVEELVRHLMAAGVQLGVASPRELQRFGLPEGVKEMIARRLASLEPQTTESLHAAAVIGRDFDASVLEGVLNRSEEEFLNALDEAIHSGLVIETDVQPGRYSFSHALVRETLYEGMSEPRRARIHRRVGQILEAAQGRRTRDIPALAHHFACAGRAEEADKAITYARQAAEQANAVFAHEEAAQHYSRALEVLERFHPEALERRCELLIMLGEAYARSGERGLAWPALREAAALAEQLGDADSLARAAVDAAHRYVQQPGVVDTELIEMLERALEMTSNARTMIRVRLLARLCGALYFSAQRDRMASLSEEAMEIAEELDDPEARAYACAGRRRAIWDADQLEARLEVSTEMLTCSRQAGNLELQLQAHAWLVTDLLERGEREAVDAQMEAFRAGARRLRQPLYIWQSIVWEAMEALLSGGLERAEGVAAEALVAGANADAVTAGQYHAIQLLAVRREQRRMAELESGARELVASNPARPAWGAVLAVMLCETERLAGAQAEFDRLAGEDFRDVPEDGDWLTTIALLSDVCVALGDARRAKLLYERLLPHEQANVVVGIGTACLGSVAGFLGKLATTVGREQQAYRHYEHALEANAALRAPVCLAHTQLDYAAAMPSGSRRQELVKAAAHRAAELGLPWVSQRVAALRES